LWFWSSGFFLAERPFRLCRYWTCVTVDIDTRSFAAVLGLICTFRTKVHSSETEHIFPELSDRCVVPWCLYLRTIVCTGECGTFRRLEISPRDETDLWRSTMFFSGLGWFLLLFPWCQAKRHWVWRYVLKYIHRYTSNWLKLCQLAYQTLLKPWHHFLEFSKLFKAVNLVYVNFWPTGIVIPWFIIEIICL
jgi:hypothetical protein